MYLQIGKLRYVSVSQFKGKPYINIREYYDDHGTQKPGKKGQYSHTLHLSLIYLCLGISLGVDQWEKLKTLIAQVDKDLKKSK